MGIEGHQRITLGAAAKILEETVLTSYEKGGKAASPTDVASKQAVKELVHGTIIDFPEPEAEEKKKLRYLHIVADDDRLKQGTAVFGKDYFKELLERVRSIRASERRIWQQITDIYAECSIDYDRNSQVTKDFYSMIQNRFHYAITGHTAAEIVYANADHSKPNMGLTTWKNAPDGRILKSDVSIAKNYLQEKEIRQLERTVSGYFDYIEDLIERENTFNMEQFASSVNEFLTFRRYQILPDKGKVSALQAKSKAEDEYDIFNKTQKIDSDFDKEVRLLKDKME